MIEHEMTTREELTGIRLTQLREEKGLSQEDLAKEIVGGTQSIISRHERSAAHVGREWLRKYAIYHDVSMDYLDGITDIRTPYRPTTPHRDEIAALKIEAHVPGPYVYLPVYEEAAAGNACFMEDHPVEMLPVNAAKVKHDLDNYVLVRVSGDSMIEKGIMPGGLVLVHLQHEIGDGQIALIRFKFDNSVTIKRVRLLPEGKLMLIPANPRLEEITVTEDEVDICGRVVQAINDFD